MAATSVRIEWVRIDEYPLVKSIVAHQVIVHGEDDPNSDPTVPFDFDDATSAGPPLVAGDVAISLPAPSSSRNLGDPGYGINAALITVISPDTAAVLVGEGSETSDAPVNDSLQDTTSTPTSGVPGILIRAGESKTVLKARDGMQLVFRLAS